MLNLLELYKNSISSNKIFYDKSQENVVISLDDLLDRIKNKSNQKDSIFFSDIFSFFKKDDNLGLYIWGDVGRGKTFLVDLFFSCVPSDKKVRLHFHHFMKLIHNSLKNYSGEKDPLKSIAKNFHKDYILLCLDEFFVKDIGDAMNLSKFFGYLFEFGVYLVITSNVVPSKLYEGGLQRQKFLPTIRLFEKFLKVISLDSAVDYRYIHLSESETFFYNAAYKSFKSMKKIFFKISRTNPKRKVFLKVSGREIFAYYVSESIVWFGFEYICGFGRSQLDYVELANSFKLVFLSGVKQFSSLEEDSARRFIALIDEFYDRKIKILISFSCDSFLNLYCGELLKFDFKRTISRLNEMSSKFYLKESLNESI